jgi:hypothetical protein
LAASLEFYLKEVILFVIDSFRRHKHITALDEIYGRAELNYLSILGTLEAQNAGNDIVASAIFNSLVIQEKAPASAPAIVAPVPAPTPVAAAPEATKPKL